jgi:protein dithiol oxidoreductase (disulfide-forming)
VKKTNLAFLRLLFTALCLTAAWGAPAHAESQPEKPYTLISPPQPTETGKNIEVLEFFSYGCPHCYDLEPVIAPWAKKLAQDVTFRRLPAVFSESWMTYAKVYYAAEAMGVIEKLHPAIFSAVHVQHLRLDDEKTLMDWVGKQGLDNRKFAEIYASFAVTSKAQRAKQLTRAFNISGVPTVVVEGKFETSASLAGGHTQLLPVLDALIQKARQERSGKK